MFEKITIDMLTESSVSIKKQKYIEVDEVEYPVGDPWRRAYVNSVSGRAAVQAELPLSQQNAIFAVWGDEPTVDESSSQ